mmetsp:Transcript_5688/g.13894  ORF Transcript_5688/g.13894 Transcript_5688/m.13894 type:complete len:217 (+) Transcript_5688:168-818(+)
MGADARGVGGLDLWLPEEGPARPLALCLGCRAVVGRPVCPVVVVGPHAAAVGPVHGDNHPPLCRPHQRRPLRGLLQRQSPNRLWLARQNHQALEHSRRVQVYHRKGRPQRVGLVRPLQPQRPATHRLGRLGQARQSLELGHLQAQDKPPSPHGLHQRRHRLPRRLPLRLRRQGRRRHVVGTPGRQAPLLARGQRHHPRPVLLAQPLLAVRRHKLVH